MSKKDRNGKGNTSAPVAAGHIESDAGGDLPGPAVPIDEGQDGGGYEATPDTNAATAESGVLPAQGPTRDELVNAFLAARTDYETAMAHATAAKVKRESAEHEIGRRLATKGKGAKTIIGGVTYYAARVKGSQDHYELRREAERVETSW